MRHCGCCDDHIRGVAVLRDIFNLCPGWAEAGVHARFKSREFATYFSNFPVLSPAQAHARHTDLRHAFTPELRDMRNQTMLFVFGL